jgi:hypothetical protein
LGKKNGIYEEGKKNGGEKKNYTKSKIPLLFFHSKTFLQSTILNEKKIIERKKKGIQNWKEKWKKFNKKNWKKKISMRLF